MKRLHLKPGDQYGRLTVVRELPQRGKERMFLCGCSCGNKIEVQLNNLRSGNTNSCGCYQVSQSQTDEIRAKISSSQRKRVAEGLHHMWKGGNASYYAIHIYLKNYYGKASKCENPVCTYPRTNSKGVYLEKPLRYEWACITGKYSRKLEDYRQLCPSCHRQYDLGLINIAFKRIEAKGHTQVGGAQGD